MGTHELAYFQNLTSVTLYSEAYLSARNIKSYSHVLAAKINDATCYLYGQYTAEIKSRRREVQAILRRMRTYRRFTVTIHTAEPDIMRHAGRPIIHVGFKGVSPFYERSEGLFIYGTRGATTEKEVDEVLRLLYLLDRVAAMGENLSVYVPNRLPVDMWKHIAGFLY
jgi:hypothetical protein